MLLPDGHPCDADHPLDLAPRTAAHAGNQRVPRGEPRELDSRLLRNVRVLRPGGDGRERAVDVEQDGGPLGLRGEQTERVVGHRRPGYERCAANGVP